MKLTLIQEGIYGCITAAPQGISTGTLAWITCADPERRTLQGKRFTEVKLRNELRRMEKAGLVTLRDGKWVAQ